MASKAKQLGNTIMDALDQLDRLAARRKSGDAGDVLREVVSHIEYLRLMEIYGTLQTTDSKVA